MMKYTKCLTAIVAFFFATACAMTDIDEAINIGNGTTSNGGDVRVHCRIANFTDCNVYTRSDKSDDEAKVTSMALALFPIVDGEVGTCEYYEYKDGNNIVFVIDRNKDFANASSDQEYAMYVFANMHGCDDFPKTSDTGKGKTIEEFVKFTHTVSTDIKEVPENGFPMIGSLGDYINTAYGSDGKKFVLKPSSSTNNLPTVDGTATDNLEIPMKALFAKVSFTIKVTPTQDIASNAAPRFNLTDYWVNNVPTTVDLNSKTNSDDTVNKQSNTYSPTGLYAQGANEIKLEFYLPERYLTPSVSAEEFTYPFGDGSTTTSTKGYSNLRKEDQQYAQRFKGMLAEGYASAAETSPSQTAKPATYLTIKGKFRDHQEHWYDVIYKIYLGGDNYGNFDIIRNTHYINTVTLRGIQNSNDQTDGGIPTIAYDHRVDVERSTPLIINLRRETLLDAHFEVRPLRLLLPDESTVSTNATVEVLNSDGTAVIQTTDSAYGDLTEEEKAKQANWIRLEYNNGTGSATTTHCANGKRLYFTTDLVTSTLAASTSVTVPLSTSNQTIWIYVDENTASSTSKVTRDAMVRISWDADGNGTIEDDEITDYIIQQYNLHEVTYGGYTYLIECHEEYLYNYDAEDSYSQTEQNGMPWGLDGVQLSSKHPSIYVTSGTISGLIDFFVNESAANYDFYLVRDKPGGDSKTHDHEGFDFASEIRSAAGISYQDLASTPQSAVQYCYNKNKQGATNWYLPAIDEIEDIVMGAYDSYPEFQEKFYWSCQPAYERNYIDYYIWPASASGWFFRDDIDRARSTRVIYDGGYSNTSSGVVSGKYTNTLYIRELNFIIPNITFEPTTERGSEGLYYEGEDDSYYESGNLPRTSKARVRCVYKAN